MRYTNCSFNLRILALALTAGLVSAAGAQAQTKTVCLIANTFTGSGAAAGVPMWGYALAHWTGNDCNWELDGTDLVGVPVATSPGPRITLLPGEANLEIHLQNRLPVATSIVIPGLPSAGLPARLGPTGRATSFTTEVVAATQCDPNRPGSCVPGAPGVYTWSTLRPGTFMYQSGSHVQVQVQMGLYGAVTRDDATYPGKAYGSEVVLFYSEVDPGLHQSVATGNYKGLITIPKTVIGTAPVMTSTYNYKPRYFLVNGDAYPGASTAITAGGAGTTTLIRFLNAGLRTHVPTLLNGDFELLAEDAWPYPYARRQVQLSLLAGKTMDVLWTPTNAGSYAIFDRTPHLTNDGDGPGGMIATLTVGGTITARPDTYGARNDKPLVVGAPGVMGNDSAIISATLVTDVAEGTLVFNSDGSLSYTAPSTTFTGQVTFTYQQPGSNTAQVTINVGPNTAPSATDGLATTNEDTPVPITLTATDANSDPLTFAIATSPGHGTLSGTPPNVTYTPALDYNGPDSFTFTASDDLATSPAAAVNITVTAVNDPPVATPASWPTNEDTPTTKTLTGTDVDLGTTLTFRVTTPPANGTLTGTPPTLTYTPRLDYFGTDSFRFVANDGTVDSPVATISIPVAAAPDNPIAANDTYSTKYNASLTMNVLANDKDPDGTPLTILGTFPKCFSMPPSGSTLGTEVPCTGTGQDRVTINSSLNRLTLVPNSAVRPPQNVGGFRTFTFQYQAKDASGANSPAASVTVRVLR